MIGRIDSPERRTSSQRKVDELIGKFSYSPCIVLRDLEKWIEIRENRKSVEKPQRTLKTAQERVKEDKF